MPAKLVQYMSHRIWLHDVKYSTLYTESSGLFVVITALGSTPSKWASGVENRIKTNHDLMCTVPTQHLHGRRDCVTHWPKTAQQNARRQSQRKKSLCADISWFDFPVSWVILARTHVTRPARCVFVFSPAVIGYKQMRTEASGRPEWVRGSGAFALIKGN